MCCGGRPSESANFSHRRGYCSTHRVTRARSRVAIGVSVIGFEVIGDAEKYLDREIPNPRMHDAAHPGSEQAGKPQLSVSRE